MFSRLRSELFNLAGSKVRIWHKSGAEGGQSQFGFAPVVLSWTPKMRQLAKVEPCP
jgi:hypothetical protein